MKEAIQVAESAVKANEQDAGFRTLLGGLYLIDGQNDKASASYRRSLELDPKSAGARLGLARLAVGQKREEEAIGHLQAALKDRPDLRAIRVELEHFLDDQREGYARLYDPKAGLFDFGWDATRDRLKADGVRVVDEKTNRRGERQFFISPRSGFGTLIQFWDGI